MAQTTVQLLLARIAAWNQAHPGRQIDPQAELAVAKQEGLSGGIGDGGHAFGPNQLNNAGGVLTGKFSGQSADQINRWAWTPQGIDYALAGVANVSGGEKGQRAVSDIVSRFERPANIPKELANALAAYGIQPGQGSPAPAAASTVAQGSPIVQQLAQQATPKPAPAPVDFTPKLLGALASANGNYGAFYQMLSTALRAQR